MRYIPGKACSQSLQVEADLTFRASPLQRSWVSRWIQLIFTAMFCFFSKMRPDYGKIVDAAHVC